MVTIQPGFSIIIPTFRRSASLGACLAALSRLDYPRRSFEVLVVDDGSGAPPEETVEPYRRHFEVCLLTQSHAGPGAARNTGSAHARGEILAFTDDDCRPDPSWLSALATQFASTPEHMVAGHVANALDENPYARASQVLSDLNWAYFNTGRRGLAYCASNNVAVPATRFREVGGFASELTLAGGEDREFCDRWQQRGYGLTWAPAAIVYHAHPLTFRGFLRQNFHYGRGGRQYYRSRARHGSDDFKPNVGLYLRILSYPLSAGDRSPFGRLGLGVLLLGSQVAVAAGFAAEALTRAPGQAASRLG